MSRNCKDVKTEKASAKKIIKKAFSTIGVFVLLIAFLSAIVSSYFFISTDSQIIETNSDKLTREYVMILGCGVDGENPSWLLKNRLEAGIVAFNEFNSKKFILSGSTDGDYYDEVEVMKNYLMNKGFSEHIIIEDKMGDDTFDSVYNAIQNEYADSMVIVTQNAHLRRAVFIANNLGANEVIGYKAEPIPHSSTMIYMELREIPARIKAVVEVMGIDLDL